MTRHRARTPRADKPLPVKRERTDRHAEDDRAERMRRLADVLVAVDERLAAEAAASQATGVGAAS